MRIKNICCIGAGYVGGPTMSVIALKCPEINITVVDKSEKKIDSWNNKDLSKLPVFEPGLSDVIKKVRNKNLFFSTNIKQAIQNSEMIFLAVNTPTKKKGKGKGMAADLSNIISSAKEIANFSFSDKIIVEKSTLPVRTAEKLKEILHASNKNVKFEILSNPEFLAEGSAIKDLFKSDRVLIGGDDTDSGRKAINSLFEIYKKWIPKEKILVSNVWSAELSKLASNAFLAQRISSINSLSAFCEKTGANILEISKAIGADHRIGNKFLQPSAGFGGSCFQKDILNLVYLAKSYGLTEVADYWNQVIKINNYQRSRFADLIESNLEGDLVNKKITVLGWAFKKNTNDTRESSSIYVTEHLLSKGAFVNIYDPKIKSEKIIQDITLLLESLGYSKREIQELNQRISIFNNCITSMQRVDAVAILTEWDEFKEFNWQNILSNEKYPKYIFDGRLIINEKKVPKQIKLITI
jgi:UDPglucose 6-dehydrogenase